MAFSGKGASKPFLTPECPFISFFLDSLWSGSESDHLGLPAVTHFPQKNPYLEKLPGLSEWMRLSVEYHLGQV